MKGEDENEKSKKQIPNPKLYKPSSLTIIIRDNKIYKLLILFKKKQIKWLFLTLNIDYLLAVD